MTPKRFKNKNVVITGAGTGIGRACAQRLAQEGANVVLLGRREDLLITLKREIEQQSGTAITIPCDISAPTSLANAVRCMSEQCSELHGVFANAGVLGEFQALQDTPIEQVDHLIATNLKGTLLTIQHCLPLMSKGAIVINASWTANAVMPGAGAYAGTKGALLAMMKTLAVELGSRAITVNAVNPGIILTPMADDVLEPEIAQKLAAHTALKRNGTPEDIAGTVAWLLSEDAAFVTGQEITVDGGYTLGGIRL